ncbi:MAG TPA: metallophosphoesterase [Candidatus Limnocylindria bacterium]|nr:metallophosphoesterase [Candidatus Limnocylindria bacterium]
MSHRLQVAWPDGALFASRSGRPFRILAVSDERARSLDAAETRAAMGRIDLVIGAGDLEPPYLSFVADAFGAPLRYVRGNHDVGAAWLANERGMLPEPLRDGRPVEEQGLTIVGFSGSPRYNAGGRMQISAAAMWWRVAWARLRAGRRRPVLVVTHAAPRDLGDAPDPAHRGFAAFRWLVEQLRPPLWLHGHTALIRRGIDSRCVTHRGTLVYNCTGATVIELVPAS